MEFQLASLYESLTDAGPDFVCLAAGDVRHTRARLDARANQLAHHLLMVGVEPTERVGILTYNRAEHVEAMLACWKISAVPINLNYRYVADELRYIWDDAGLVGLIAERSFMPVVDDVVQDLPPSRTHIVIEDGSDHQPNHDVIGYEEALAAQPGTRDFGVPRSADDLYVIYTGGTTGMPKGVMWRHEDIFFAAMGGGNYFEPITEPEQIAINATEPPLPMNMAATAPLMHAAGQWVTMIGIFSGGKAALYTDRHFDASNVLDLVDREGAATLSLVGDAMAIPVIEEQRRNPRDMPAMFAISNGGAMMSPSTREVLAEVFPGKIINDGFGSSETGTVGSGANTSVSEEGSHFNVRPDTAVLDPDTLEEMPQGETGMMATTGHIPIGYMGDPDKSAATFRQGPDGRRWVMSGDWAVMEDDGRMLLLGRGSNTINTGGEKVHPEEVESVCWSHPKIADVIITGAPDERWGSKVVALVQPTVGDTITLEELQDHCRSHLAGYKIPRELLVTDIQHTNVGKPDVAWAKRQVAHHFGSTTDGPAA